MAAAADWKKELGEAGRPPKAQETLLKMGYITKVSFVKAFKTLDALEPFLKKLLLEDKVAGDVKPEFWEWHPVSGVLRGLWEADAKAAGVQQVVVNPPTTAQAGLLSLVGGPKLEAGQLRDLWKKFATNYPSEWLDEHTRPCRQVLQHVWQQQREKDLRFIPWKHLLSESQWERSKKTFEKKEKSLLGFLAEQAGHIDQVEVVVSPSPFAVQRTLSLRAVAWAVLGWCHLGAANALVRKFVALYSHPVAPELGLRPQSIVEAEAADLEVCRQFGESLNEGLTLDQALHECVKGPTLCTLLQLRPKMSKGHEVKESERVRPPKRARKKTCHKFQIGRCKNEKCQYAHVCEHCEGEHGRAKCPELKQP